MSQVQKTRWLKTVAVVLAVLTLVYWISPRAGAGTSAAPPTPQVNKHQEAPPVAPPTQPISIDSKDGQVPMDSSYGTDRCERSVNKSKPIVQYVIMIDAGSTGSRIHVYKFNNCGPTPELEGEVFEKVVGGLSKYKDDPEAAAQSLDPLMEIAQKNVPEVLKSCSPIAVKATAGLRMIGAESADKILKAVRSHLETDYPFPVVSARESGVAIMDGSDEGVYAWITTNYLLGKIGGPDHSETAAVFDLGGGSTQIVFEPTFKGAANGGMPEKLADGDHKYKLSFGGRDFTLYQHSHLGYGLMAARDTIHRTLLEDIFEERKSEGNANWIKEPIVNPCIIPGTSRNVTVKMSEKHPLGDSVDVTMVGPSVPAPAICRNLAEKTLQKEAHCELAPCSFNGVHQPMLSKTFSKEDVYVFSYFYDRLKPLGMPDSFTLREMHDMTNTVCHGEEAWGVFSSVPGALEELRDRPEHCLDLNFMMALLHTGYDMPIDREVRIAQKIKGNELGWCLGASLPLLAPGSGWTCKFKEVQ